MSSPVLNEDTEAQRGVDGRKTDDTNERGLWDNTITQASAENYGDTSGKLWSIYLTASKKEDVKLTKNWTDDTQGVLVFTGLFSSIIATFITISLPQLSPDPNTPTVALLTQLVNITAETARVSVTLPDNPPFKAPAFIVRVNVMWFLSLILSLSCALLATLMQQWARRYLDYAQHADAPRKQARIRAYMFEGVENLRLSQAVEAMPFLLHASVFLFFAGLIEFLFSIHDTVAHYTLGCVVFFASIYAILTLVPTWRLNCPYRTPLSGITYYSFQFSASGLLSVVKAIESIFHGLLMKLWQFFHPHTPMSQDHGPTKWREALERMSLMCCERSRNGLRWRVEDSAVKASSSVDKYALHWTLKTLGENKKFEEFAAHMPGFFNSTAIPDATSAMLSLMSEPASEPILGSRLRELLNTCLPGSSHVTEDQRQGRLRVCLTSLWYCLKAFNLDDNLEMPLAPYVRAVFASPQVIQWIQTERDFAVRLLGRCFGSLVVKKLASDIASPARTDPPTVAEIACIKTILGATGEQVCAWLSQKGAIDLANVTLLASGEADTLAFRGAKGVPADVVDVFQQTLHIIGEGMSSIEGDKEQDKEQDKEGKVEWNADQVTQFHEIYFSLANAPIPALLKERLEYIRRIVPSPSYMEDPKMVMPAPELYPVTTLPDTRPDSGYADVD